MMRRSRVQRKSAGNATEQMSSSNKERGLSANNSMLWRVIKCGIFVAIVTKLEHVYNVLHSSVVVQEVVVDDATVPEFRLHNILERIKARNAYLGTKNTDISEWGWKTGGPPAFHKVAPTKGTVISLLSPVYHCPWTLHRTNYVSDAQFDGGKWSCGLVDMYKERRKLLQTARGSSGLGSPKETPLPCIIYSFGSNNDDFFEADVLKQNPDCELHIFDPTSGVPPPSWKDRGYHFHSSGLCVGDATSFSVEDSKKKTTSSWPCKSLQMHMLDLGHTHVDLVKADVEGMEWDLTSNWGNENRIGQILLEFHFWVKSPPLPVLLRDHFIPLERMGYFMSTIEPVAANIDSYEISFLNINWSPAQGTDHNFFDATMYPSTPGVVI